MTGILDDIIEEINNILRHLDSTKDMPDYWQMMRNEQYALSCRRDLISRLNEMLKNKNIKRIYFGKYLCVAFSFSQFDYSISTVLTLSDKSTDLPYRLWFIKDRHFKAYCKKVFEFTTARDLVGGFPATFKIDRVESIRHFFSREYNEVEIDNVVNSFETHVDTLIWLSKDKKTIDTLDKSVEAYMSVYKDEIEKAVEEHNK